MFTEKKFQSDDIEESPFAHHEAYTCGAVQVGAVSRSYLAR